MPDSNEVLLFISHHSSTLDTALEVETALAKRGVSCWIAPRDVEPGEPFDNAVRAAIERSSAILLLFCEKSDQSKHVKRELILGDSAGRPIIPLRLESVQPRELAYHLADSQWIDWNERREAVMDRVAAQARQYASVPASGGERPSRPIDAPAHSASAAPIPVNAAPTGTSNRPMFIVTIAALLVAAVAVTWIVARGGNEADEDIVTAQQNASESDEDAEGTGGASDGENLAAAATPDDRAPAPPTPLAAPTESLPAPAEPQPAQAIRPSFDCARASTTREFLICGSPRLAAQDRELASLYRRARAMVRGTGQAARLRADQRAWLAQVQSCTDENCVEMLQSERIRFFRNALARGG